tara:strand:- start:4721 stop:4855 length:135 start_codon:yes stop_codon:yes gene_type:complete
MQRASSKLEVRPAVFICGRLQMVPIAAGLASPHANNKSFRRLDE